ncbi:MAG TPA: serine hydrolase domain-containing protein [Acidimicrobiales bacterium]|nr:serine hydrolase domain-containing protein [Acidimicrobiales bacterium]
MAVAVGGNVEPGYEAVRDRFMANFEELGEVGAGFSLYVDGAQVVDLWGGTADQHGEKPYDEDTLQLVFSTTKGATAACANLLAQRGELDVDLPVAHYWPEFAQAGKARLPVRYLLCHKAGLPVFEGSLSAEEVFAWDPVIRALESSPPIWDPGSTHGYHAVTYGYLVGEVVRRISGKSLGTFFHDEFARPLGLEFWIGLPEEHEHRVARLVGALAGDTPGDGEASVAVLPPDSLIIRATTLNGALDGLEHGFNNPALMRAEMPAANGITNARSLARFYAGLIGTVEGGPAGPLLSPVQVNKARTRQTEGRDRVLSFPGLDIETAFGLGFWAASPMSPFGGAPGAFGHSGAGGSVGFADPDQGIAVGYVMNKMMQNVLGDPRSLGLIQASYQAAGRPLA